MRKERRSGMKQNDEPMSVDLLKLYSALMLNAWLLAQNVHFHETGELNDQIKKHLFSRVLDWHAKILDFQADLELSACTNQPQQRTLAEYLDEMFE